MDPLMVIQSQLLATKFYVPISSGTLISHPRLSALLTESLKYPLTLVSAPAGFGKTMLLSAWIQSLPANSSLVGWVSLDEEDNDPQLFWTYALSSFDQQQPERFTPLLKYLQSPVAPPLEQTHAHLVPILHARASRWYAQHHQTAQAILHAFKAHEWQWAADLIEHEYPPTKSLTWRAGKHEMVQLRQWLEQLPTDIMCSQPRLCLTCVHMLWNLLPYSILRIWLDAAEATLTASLLQHSHADALQTSILQKDQDLLGEVITLRALLWCHMGDGHIALPLCQ